MNPATTPISLILVEDNRLLRQGLTEMVSRHAEFRILAAIGDGDSVLQKVEQLHPQVVLLDLGLRGQNSLRLVESLRKDHPHVSLIVMDLLPAEADVIDFVKAGVAGFLMKDATFDEFLRTIRTVAQGTKVLPPSLTTSLFSQIAHIAARREKALGSSAVRLTKRERQIIGLIADGQSNKEIAQELNIATFTVKSHVHNILEKLALRTRLQVASFYANEGPVSIEAFLKA
jgi:DNA-binding NarL/FixJ family response regulator